MKVYEFYRTLTPNFESYELFKCQCISDNCISRKILIDDCVNKWKTKKYAICNGVIQLLIDNCSLYKHEKQSYHVNNNCKWTYNEFIECIIEDYYFLKYELPINFGFIPHYYKNKSSAKRITYGSFVVCRKPFISINMKNEDILKYSIKMIEKGVYPMELLEVFATNYLEYLDDITAKKYITLKENITRKLKKLQRCDIMHEPDFSLTELLLNIFDYHLKLKTSLS